MQVPFGHESQYFSSPVYQKEIWQEAQSVDFWLRANPGLHFTEKPLVACSGYEFSEENLRICSATLKEDGYFHTNTVIPIETCRLLSESILRLIHAGIHPLFALVYDEYWQILHNCTFFFRKLLELDFFVRADFWVWAVHPSYAQSGWGPHRDQEIEKPFFEDGRPTRINLWIALTDADPSNGCIYVLPKSLDPQIPDHPEIQKVENVQHATALPTPAGSILGWDQHVLHWGGRCSKYPKQPRISFACYFQEKDFDLNKDLTVNSTSILSLEERLSYIGQVFLKYQDRFEFPTELLQATRGFVNRYEFLKVSDISQFKKMFER